ncbi:hypothetical protein CONLIGDRAFT_274497 [Coniochaeta ligniaria NRRL 30616]|uniref:HTH APSES-type domain-containing protein n=1 Tax=Coniochaeta ligniaria NRRL 30616 TaxID=1408157 RepID=A0A1J7IXX6_9PEZI|nr:hypothetical protein CONLIGDRAFT_274497 [Coniochaeta ligniaria NRRL 30616]
MAENVAPARHLPARHNPLMTEDVPQYADLVSRRRLGQTQLTARMVSTPKSADADPSALPAFDYAHLRAPLPKGIVSGIFKSSPSSYFLMRRSDDGYVSATGMFKATFPYATIEEEEMERRYIKSLPTTSPEETAGNVWIPPDQALSLAEEYHIIPWIRALLDPTDIQVSSGTDSSPPKKISAPPKFFAGQPIPTSLIPRSVRTRRSVSPTKSASTRSTASPRKRSARKTASKTSDGETPASSVKHSKSPSLTNGDIPQLVHPAAAGTTAPSTGVKIHAEDDDDIQVESHSDERAVVLHPVEEEPKLHVHVNQDITVDEQTGEETTHTKVDVEIPLAGVPPSAEEAARMVAEAREMVKAAAEGMAATAAQTDDHSVESKKNKRKADFIETEEEEGKETAGDATIAEIRQSKRIKTEVELKKERIKKRAFIGISATLAVGALIPYVMGVL